MKYPRTSPDVKEQIINRIKNDGVTVADAAKEHGLDPSTIYSWLGAKAEGSASVLELAKLRRENDELLRLVGLMTLKLNESQKKK